MNKNQAVFKDTMKMIEESSELKNSVNWSIENSKVINCTYALTDKEKNKGKWNNIYILENETSFGTAKHYSELFPKYKICVLNFANEIVPGGGVINGCTAQEESLCRCSTLYPVLSSDKLKEQFYERHINVFKYLSGDFIYTPNVKIIKDEDFDVLKNPINVDIITAAAPDQRKTFEIISYDKLHYMLYIKIENFIKYAAEQNVDILILGAFGCGAFLNDPHHVAELFRKALLKYSGYFKKVIFPIKIMNSRDEHIYETFTLIFK